MFFRKGFKAEGGVNLVAAKIGGNLTCDGGQFIRNGETLALDANGVEVKKNVSLNNGFKADGGADLVTAKIGGNLECDRGHFVGNDKVLALDANCAQVNGNAFLSEDFKAEGGVNLVGAKIDGHLNCDGGQFLGNDKVLALDANRAEVKSSIYLRNGFKAEGGVNFGSAKIDGSLECSGGQFIGNDKIPALDANGVEVKGSVLLRDGFKAEGSVLFVGGYVGRAFQWSCVESPEKAIIDLRLTKVGTLLNPERSWPSKGNLRVDGFTYDQMDDSVPPNAEVQLAWLQRQPSDKFLSQPYEQLAAVLGKMGLEADARRVMIVKNEDQAAHLHWRFRDRYFPFAWLWYGFFGKLIGYGYRPWNAFILSIIVIAIGWLFFERGYHSNLVTPTGDKAYVVAKDGTPQLSKYGRPQVLETYPKYNAIVYSLETFVPLLKLQVSQYWIPNANCGARCFGIACLPRLGSLLRWYTHFHIVAGWVLTTLWVGGLAGLVKT